MAAATGITIMSLLLGAAAAACAPDAAMAIMAGGQQAAMGKFLAFSRTQDSSADQAGASRSEERRVGKEGVSSVDLGGRRIIKKKKIPKTSNHSDTSKQHQ